MSMNLPTIRGRVQFERVIYNGKTPKYRISKYAGSSEFWAMLKESFAGRDGNISVYLQGELESVAKKTESAETFLQVTRGGLRLTGLYNYYQDGKPSGYAFGNPLQTETYSSKQKQNPLYPYKADGYLFRFEPDKENPNELLPVGFEWIVLQGTDVERLKSMYLSVYRIGGFDEALSELPLQSVDTL